MIGRQSGDHRPISGVCLLMVLLIKCHRPIIWRSSADKSADLRSISWRKFLPKRRLIIDRRFKVAKPLKLGGSINETFNLGASRKKSSADQKINQNRRSRRRPIFPHRRRETIGLGNEIAVFIP